MLLFRQNIQFRGFRTLNTDLGGIKFIEFGLYDYLTMSVDDVVKDIFNKIPADGTTVFICHFVRGQDYKMVMQSYRQIRDYGSAILFSYAYEGVIYYKKYNGILEKYTTDWVGTVV